MKRSVSAAVVLLMVVSLLSACKGAATPTAAPTTTPQVTPASQATNFPELTKAPEATKVPEATKSPEATKAAESTQIIIWHSWAGDSLKPIEAAFKAYEAAHPGITIELAKVDNLSDALAIAIPAREGPDILAWTNDQIGSNALSGHIVALNDFGIDEDFLKSTYEPAAANGMIWNGQIWGLPETQEGITLVYNKALVKESDFPTDPQDFNGLLAAAKTFAEKNPGKFLICNQGLGNPDAYHVAPIYFGHGVPSYVDDQGKVYLNTPEGLAAAEWIKAFSAYAPKESGHDICQSMLLEGRAAAWWTDRWAIADVEAAKLDYGLKAFGRPFVGVRTLMLTRNAVDRKHAEAALDVMKYYTSADVQKGLALVNRTVPAASAAINSAELKAVATIQGLAAAFALGVPTANTPYADAQWDPVGDATTAIWNGSQTPADAMQAAQAAIEDKIQQMKSNEVK